MRAVPEKVGPVLPDLVRFSVKARNQDSKVMSAEILMSTHYKKKKKNQRSVDQTEARVWSGDGAKD